MTAGELPRLPPESGTGGNMVSAAFPYLSICVLQMSLENLGLMDVRKVLSQISLFSPHRVIRHNSFLFSSPEHKVLMVSYCERFLSVVCRALHSRGHIYCLIFMKLGQNMCPNYILDKFENSSGWMKNIAARGRGSFPYMAIVKPC